MRHRNGLTWTAQRHGHDWKDADVLAAVEWLSSFAPKNEIETRIEFIDASFQAAKEAWRQERPTPLYDPRDTIAWYLHQASCYAHPSQRPNFFEHEGYRIAPVFKRLGQVMPSLRQVQGIEDRMAHLLIDARAQPDDAIYELLVAAVYKEHGWESVAFVPEEPGIRKRPDLIVERGNESWAIECKRTGRSGYAREERLKGERMSQAVHEASLAAGRAIRMTVRFKTELQDAADGYLGEKAEAFLDANRIIPAEWDDEIAEGRVGGIDWAPLREVLLTDDVYFGSSRMIELVLGGYSPYADYSLSGRWHPGEGRPFHATRVDHVSLVAWTSVSEAASRRKAKHFRSLIGKASLQLPGDRPGIVHVCYETTGGSSPDRLRHHLNKEQMRTFDGSGQRLEWVYASYLTPEHVTDRNESAALTETTAEYRVGAAKEPPPIPLHLLFGGEIL